MPTARPDPFAYITGRSTAMGASALPASGQSAYTAAFNEWEQQSHQEEQMQRMLRNIQSTYEAQYTEGLGAIEGMGASETENINRQFEGASSKATSGLMASGFAGSTVLPTVQAGIEREKSSALGGLNDRLLRTRLDWMANRPDLTNIATMMQYVQGAGQGLA